MWQEDIPLLTSDEVVNGMTLLDTSSIGTF